jgi:hypothetical protein
MNQILAAPINVLSAAKLPVPASDIVHLQELGICAGRLDDIIECDGEDFALAMIEDLTVEVPLSFAGSMWPMVGKRIWLALAKGRFRAGVMS